MNLLCSHGQGSKKVIYTYIIIYIYIYHVISTIKRTYNEWELPDPKMDVLYHFFRPYFGGVSPYIALKNRPYIC